MLSQFRAWGAFRQLYLIWNAVGATVLAGIILFVMFPGLLRDWSVPDLLPLWVNWLMVGWAVVSLLLLALWAGSELWKKPRR